MRPLIGLTGNHSDIDVTLRDAYHKQIVEAGGIPVIIPPVDDEEAHVNAYYTFLKLLALLLLKIEDDLWLARKAMAIYAINERKSSGAME